MPITSLRDAFQSLLNIFKNMFRPKFESREFPPPSNYVDFGPRYFRSIVSTSMFIVISYPDYRPHNSHAFHLLTCDDNLDFVWLGGIEDISINNYKIIDIAVRTHQLFVLVQDRAYDWQKRTLLKYYTLDRCASPYIEFTGELQLDPQIVAVNGNGQDVVVVQKDGTIHFYKNNMSGPLVKKFQLYASTDKSQVNVALILQPGLILLDCITQDGRNGILIFVQEGPGTLPNANWFQYWYDSPIASSLLGQKAKWKQFMMNGNSYHIIFSGDNYGFRVFCYRFPGQLELVYYKKNDDEFLDCFNFVDNNIGITLDWDIRSTDTPTTFDAVFVVRNKGILRFSIDVDIESSRKCFGISQSFSPYTQHADEWLGFFHTEKVLYNVVCSMNARGTITLAGDSSTVSIVRGGYIDSSFLMYG